MARGDHHRHGTLAALQLARADLLAHPRRIAYLGITLAATVAAWLILATMANAFLPADSAQATDAGVEVANARSAQQMLPLRYAQRIAALAGVRDLVWLDLTLVSCADGSTITINAIDGSGSTRAARADGFAAEDVARWQGDPLGVLVDADVARDCGWQLGMGVSPLDTLSQQPLPLHVSGIAAPAGEGAKSGTALAHHAYINRNSRIAGKAHVIRFNVSAQDANAQEALAARIEAEFAHDDPPVTAYPDTVADNARARFGKVQSLLMLVAVALFIGCALALASVMAHAVAQRRPQLALLRVLGFPRRALLLGFALELTVVVLIGALLGTFTGRLALGFMPDTLRVMFNLSQPANWAWRPLSLAMLGLLAIALVAPTLITLRVRPTDTQR